MAYRIKNWDNHQHFKDRTPPWIKLHRELLNDPDWFLLSGDDAKTLVMLWLIASEDKTMSGFIPDVRILAFRLRKSEKEVNQQLTRLKGFLYQDDINVISECYQLDIPETETETETDTETPKSAFCFKTELLKLGVGDEVLSDWLAVRKAKKAKNTKTAFDGFMREVQKAGWGYEQAVRHCCEKNWSGFDSEWVNGIVPQQVAEPQRPAITLETRREAMQAQADEGYKIRKWLDGERRYRTVFRIEGESIKATKEYESEVMA